MTTIATPVKPDVLNQLGPQERLPVNMDTILSTSHLSQLTESPSSCSLQVVGNLEKSVSTSTLAERRRLPVSPEKLKLFTQIKNANTTTNFSNGDEKVLKRLQEENAKLPTQDSEEYMLAHIERQNALLNADPKSICIESNRLQADFTTIRNLVSDATFSPTREDYEETIQAMLAKTVVKSNDVEYKEDDWDFWQTIVEDFPNAVAKLPHLLAAKLRCGGIPHRIRGIVWQSMAQSTSLNLESLYTGLCEGESPYERVIQRDLSRTFPQLDMFKADGGEGQLAMGRLLKAYSLYDAHVGYCQGLAFLVGPLLMTMPENGAFCVFVRLMETYEMRTMFTLNMEGLHLRLHQFGTLLSQLCPRLDAHLANHSIHTAMYASQWYLTLFAYSFPISLVLRIYDLVFAEGAVETITRVAVAIMQKNQDILLQMDDFEQLMMYLSSRKLYEIAFGSDPEAVIADTMALSTVITKQKMDNISENYQREIEQEKVQAQQVLAIRFANSSRGKKSPNKRDSWFPWSSSPTAETPTEIPTQDRTIPLLHQQIEDLVTALSQLQKENSKISEDLMASQMREMDLLTERDLMLQRITNFEKHVEPSPVASIDGRDLPDKKVELKGFVDSLRLSGDFGALVAGALSPTTVTETSQARSNMITPPASTTSNDMDEVTSELVSIKLANFEMGLKYQRLCQEHEEVLKSLNNTSEGQLELVNKIVSLQTALETLQVDNEQMIEERDYVLQENEELSQKMLATKQTCADLQLEKMSLEADCQRSNERVKELEDQRREYLMPRGSFTEEVFAAHQTLFGPPPMSRRHTLQILPSSEDRFQAKYIESDLRCRELEKILAETKLRLVEYETAGRSSTTSSRLSYCFRE